MQILVEEGVVQDVVDVWKQASRKPGNLGAAQQPAALASCMAAKNCQMLSVSLCQS